LYQLALDTALTGEMYSHASIVCGNRSDLALRRDQYADSLDFLEQMLSIARRIGERRHEWLSLSEMTYALTMLGRWEEALARLAEIPVDRIGKDTGVLGPMSGILEMYLQRGQLDQARRLLSRFEEIAGSGDAQAESAYLAAVAAVRFAEGNPTAALAAAEQAFATRQTQGIAAQGSKLGFLHALEAARALGQRGRINELLEVVETHPPGLRPPFLASVAQRFRAHLAGEDPGADRHFTAAAAQLRALELPFHLAVVQLEHGEWLTARGRPDDARPLLAEARETFERLQAQPWLDRIDAVAPGAPAEVVV
jgi:tetratricopeptide (TPR) repeat protein